MLVAYKEYLTNKQLNTYKLLINYKPVWNYSQGNKMFCSSISNDYSINKISNIMASQLDPWLTKNLQITKSMFNHNLQISKSSQVIGRKINNASLTLKSQKIKKFSPNIVLLPVAIKKPIDSSRAATVKHSSRRSLSLSKILPPKVPILDIPHYVSPPRQIRFKREKRKNISQIIEQEPKPEKIKSYSMKHILTDSLYKLHQEKQEVMKKEIEERVKQETHREKLKATNDKIRKKNSKTKKPLEFNHRKPWGSHCNEISDPKSSENDELRSKIRSEREIMKKEGRRAIGLDLYPNVKIKRKAKNKSEEKVCKKVRDPDPEIVHYIMQKKKSRRVATLQNKLEETLKERDRLQALERLEKTQHKRQIKKNSKKKRKDKKNRDKDKAAVKALWNAEYDKSTEMTQPLYRRQEILTESNEDAIEPKEILSKQLRDLQKRVTETQDLIKTQAALIIQKWIRGIQSKIHLKPMVSHSESLHSSELRMKTEDWVDIIETPKKILTGKSDLAQEFTEKLIEKHAEIEKTVLNNKHSNREDHNTERVTPSHSLINHEEVESDSFDESSGEFSYEEPPIIRTQPKVVHKVPPLTLNFLKSSKKISESMGRIKKKSSANSSYQSDSLDASLIDKQAVSPVNPQISFDLQSSHESYNLGNANRKISGVYENYDHTEPRNSDLSLRTFNYYPQNEEGTPKDSLDYESFNSDTENNKETPADINDPELHLKSILSKNANPNRIEELIERPSFNLRIDSGSSDEEWSSQLVLHPDSNISERQLEQRLIPCQTTLPSLPQTDSVPNSFSNPPPYQNFVNEFEDEITEIVNNEISYFLELIPFTLVEKEIDSSPEFIYRYLGLLQEEMRKNEEEVLEMINTPAYQDPLAKLSSLQCAELGRLCKFPSLELILLPELSNSMKVHLKTLEFPSRQVYLQMIFDCVNESLNYLRPFGTRGLPDPWSCVSSTLFGEGQLNVVFEKIQKLIARWVEVRAGSYPGDDIKDDEEKLQKLREERLSLLLTQNISDDEKKWIEYEEEETQVKIEMADQVFDFLLSEALILINYGEEV